MNEITLPIFDKINAIYGSLVVLLTYILGEHWFLFAAFLALNIFDYITGLLKARINKKSNSSKGAIGALKKVGYWLMICLAFMMSDIFIEIGETIGLNLSVTTLLGWFILASLSINEIRSIIENFVECGYNVPKILTKSLEVAAKMLDGAEKTKENEKDNENNRAG